MEIRKCLFCGKKLLDSKPIRTKFCCKKCRDRYYYKTNEKYRNRMKGNSKRMYQKMKKNPEWKKKRYKSWLKWLDKNRDKYNKYCREWHKKHRK